jgi:hypothetical protein
MAPSLGPTTIPSATIASIVLSATLAGIIGPIVYVAVLVEPRLDGPGVYAPRQMVLGRGACPSGCDCFGAKGMERISPSGKHEWFDGQCWTTTPQPPHDMSVWPIYRSPLNR